MIEGQKIIENIFQLYKRHFGAEPQTATLLPLSGSDRKYYRLVRDGQSVIAAYNPNAAENIAFLEFTKHFFNCGLPVPEVLCEDNDNHIYIISDLGDTTLFSTLPHKLEQVDFSKDTIDIYKKVLEILPKFQVEAGKGINYDLCYPRHSFDRQSIMWDLNYFKYYFLKVGGISFDEQKLENCFNDFVKILAEADSDYFLYRDFQSRNIMLVEDKPYFIDYQGGRKGALQYDVASLLYDAKANIPFNLREELLAHYIISLKNYISFDEAEFRELYKAYVLVRVFQAMGAYGFRGFIEKKPVFLQSVPYAVNNIKYLLESGYIPEKLDYFKTIAERIIESPLQEKYTPKILSENKLTVRICSFSYKKGVPEDLSGNGGGFVFDCRALPNPGREEKYKKLTGLQNEVIDFLEDSPDVEMFFDNCSIIVSRAVENYESRGFNNLMVSFGCTGGQHRSVYLAERLAKLLREKFNSLISVEHLEKDNWPLKQ